MTCQRCQGCMAQDLPRSESGGDGGELALSIAETSLTYCTGKKPEAACVALTSAGVRPWRWVPRWLKRLKHSSDLYAGARLPCIKVVVFFGCFLVGR
jgi:hypothetical protein